MAHVRTQLRDAVMTALAGLVTPLAVYSERRHNLSPELLPAVIVYLTQAEESDDLQTMQAGSVMFHVETEQTLLVELHASDADGQSVCETIDQMELEVEQALAADVSLGGLAEIVAPAGSSIETSVDQDRVIAVRAVSYTIPWRRVFGDADTAEG